MIFWRIFRFFGFFDFLHVLFFFVILEVFGDFLENF